MQELLRSEREERKTGSGCLCGLCGRCRRRCRRVGRLGFSLFNVDTAFEEGAIFDADASCRYVSGQGPLCTDIDTVSCIDVAANLAQDDNFAGVDAGGDLTISADGDAVPRKIYAALNLAVDKKRFRSCNFALDE